MLFIKLNSINGKLLNERPKQIDQSLNNERITHGSQVLYYNSTILYVLTKNIH